MILPKDIALILNILRGKHQHCNKLKTINPKQNSAEFAIILFVVLIILNHFLGGLIQAYNPALGLLFSQLFIILLPALLFIGKNEFKSLISQHRRKTLSGFIVVVAAAVPMYIITTFLFWILSFISSSHSIDVSKYSELLKIENSNIVLIILLYAVVPAICEEILFRGYFLKVFRKYGIITALIFPALMFGVFHFQYIKVLPVFISGIWLGFLAIKTKNIILPIAAHFLHNFIVILSVNFKEYDPAFSMVNQQGHYKIYYIVSALFIMFVLTKLILKMNLLTSSKDDFT
jgi:membrane protease YdiL (CAAX protease family)